MGGSGDHGVGSRPGRVRNGGCAHIPLASMVVGLVPWTGSGALVAVRPVYTRADVDWRCAGLWHLRRDAPAIANRFRISRRGLNCLRGSPQCCDVERPASPPPPHCPSELVCLTLASTLTSNASAAMR